MKGTFYSQLVRTYQLHIISCVAYNANYHLITVYVLCADIL
jgi:hypothetical protein